MRNDDAFLAAIERHGSVMRPEILRLALRESRSPHGIDNPAPLFADGNKRTETASGSYLLSTYGYEVEAEQKDLKDFAANVAQGKPEIEEIAFWFEEHSRKT